MAHLLTTAARAGARRAALASTQTIAAVAHAAPAAARFATAHKAAKSPAIKSTASVTGTHLTHSLDLAQASIGQTIDVPYERTLSDADQVAWTSVFQVHDRLFTSTPFAQSLNLPNHALPFYMVLFRAISMGHVDESREVLDVELKDAVYVRPVYAGDTLRQQFTIKHIQHTSNGENTLLTVGCELFNQHDHLVFSVDKTLLYPGVRAPTSRLSAAPKVAPEKQRSHLLSHILYNSDQLAPAANLALLVEGQLVLHAVSRPIGKSSNMSLSTLFGWTHPTIYNMRRYKDEELLVPGGLVLAASISATSRGLFETVHETLESCSFLNKVSPVDLIGAISYVHGIRQLKEGMEEVSVTTLGLKNIDVARELSGVALPRELFTMPQLHRKQVEALVAEHVPALAEKIVVTSRRTIVRQSPFAQQRSIPLL